MSLDEFECIFGRHIRPVSGRVVDGFAVDFHAGAGISTRSAEQLPQTMFVVAKVIGQCFVLAELPLTDNACRVTGITKQVGESRLSLFKQSELGVVANVVDSGHQFDARRRTDWLRITVLESHTLAGKLVQHRCLVRGAAIGPDALESKIVRHDHDDVWTALLGERRA
jgi:hypothetical protein